MYAAITAATRVTPLGAVLMGEPGGRRQSRQMPCEGWDGCGHAVQ
jgi:hypothetical protein